MTRGHVELSERIEVIVGGVAGGRVFQAGWAGLDEVGGATGGEKQVLRGAQQDGRDVGPERERTWKPHNNVAENNILKYYKYLKNHSSACPEIIL